jgi:cytochrome c peroxidase
MQRGCPTGAAMPFCWSHTVCISLIFLRYLVRHVGAPVEMTRAAIPADNPQTPEKISLGQKLFFDRRLSADDTVSCSTCHDPALAFTDRKPTSVGIKGRVGQRNAPTILNALYNKTQFWDGRVNTLEEQAALPIVNSVEMGQPNVEAAVALSVEMGQPNVEAAVAQIAAIGEYQQVFRAVFGRPPNGPDLLRAIASYERTQLSFDSPFDRFIAGGITPSTNRPSTAGSSLTARRVAINVTR